MNPPPHPNAELVFDAVSNIVSAPHRLSRQKWVVTMSVDKVVHGPRRRRACVRDEGVCHPPHHALEHLAHLARLQKPERLPRELHTVFAVNAVQKHHM
jgi:hypothetical protein